MKSAFMDLFKESCGEVTDKFLELLLGCMDLSFYLSRVFGTGYHDNIKEFSATYVFRSEDGAVGATAVFADGDMVVRHEAAERGWTARVTFKSAQALRNFLFSKNQDILNSLLKNEVAVEGNVNYIHKFAYMARNLLHRLNLA